MTLQVLSNMSFKGTKLTHQKDALWITCKQNVSDIEETDMVLSIFSDCTVLLLDFDL